jgi:hypothetical protein
MRKSVTVVTAVNIVNVVNTVNVVTWKNLRLDYFNSFSL